MGKRKEIRVIEGKRIGKMKSLWVLKIDCKSKTEDEKLRYGRYVIRDTATH